MKPYLGQWEIALFGAKRKAGKERENGKYWPFQEIRRREWMIGMGYGKTLCGWGSVRTSRMDRRGKDKLWR